jgi:hypothetical protein
MNAACQFHWHEIRRRRESEGGAGIHFPHTPFSSRPARAVWSCRAVGAALVSRSAQNRFGFGCIIAPQQIRTPQ